MKVRFSTDQQVKLSRLAAAQGRPAESLVQEAVERLFRYDVWFLGQVDEGLAAAAKGEFVDHDAVGRMIEDRFPG